MLNKNESINTIFYKKNSNNLEDLERDFLSLEFFDHLLIGEKEISKISSLLEEGMSYCFCCIVEDFENDLDLEVLRGVMALGCSNVIGLSITHSWSHINFFISQGGCDVIFPPFRKDEIIWKAKINILRGTHYSKDALTGLYNLKYIDDVLGRKRNEKYSRNEESGNSMSLVMIDVDNFKKINDSYHHIFGNFVLKEIGRIISENIRQDDIASRFGGDEFLIVLFNINHQSVLKLSERLTTAIQNHTFEGYGYCAKITVSLGYIICSKSEIPAYASYNASSSNALMIMADRALQNAKENGKNKICQYTGMQNIF